MSRQDDKLYSWQRIIMHTFFYIISSVLNLPGRWNSGRKLYYRQQKNIRIGSITISRKKAHIKLRIDPSLPDARVRLAP
jgi:hypothetical protein